jgi:phage terminase small subunit
LRVRCWSRARSRCGRGVRKNSSGGGTHFPSEKAARSVPPVEEYIVDLNGKQAAIRAGYSPKTAEVQASRLLSFAKVRKAIKAAMDSRSRRTGITADRVVLELEKLAFSNIFDFIELRSDGSVQIDLLRATRNRAAAIYEVTVKVHAESSSDEARSAKLIQIELCNKLKALDMLARHLGMFPMAGRRSRPR